jgi:hypothetical protein
LVIIPLKANSAIGQWIIPSELNDAYKQGHLESNVTTDEEEINQRQKAFELFFGHKNYFYL